MARILVTEPLAEAGLDALRAAGAKVGMNPTEASQLMVEVVKGL